MGGLLMVYISGLPCNHKHEQIIYTTIISMTEEKGKTIVCITHIVKSILLLYCRFVAISLPCCHVTINIFNIGYFQYYIFLYSATTCTPKTMSSSFATSHSIGKQVEYLDKLGSELGTSQAIYDNIDR